MKNPSPFKKIYLPVYQHFKKKFSVAQLWKQLMTNYKLITMKNKENLIYIVEDSNIIAGILNKLISSIPNTRAKDFPTGELMLSELATNEIPDMIFIDYYIDDSKNIDIYIPTMNGDAIFDEIQKIYPNLPVVLLTGMSDHNKIAEMKAKGIYHVIHKEIDDIFGAVVDCVNNYILNNPSSK